jgi:ArsR family transcriptional regulator
MALSKTKDFNKELIQIAEFAKALSHPARIEILQILADKETCICGEIVEVMPLSQSTVSQHLKELKRVGLIQGEIEGKKSCYCVNWDSLAKFNEQYEDFMQELLNTKCNNNKCC